MISDFKIVLEKISNIFFTKRCEFCGEVIEFDKTVCGDCLFLPVNKPPYCIYCGLSKDKCNCDKHKNEYKQVIAPYLYQDSVKRAVLNFKSAYMPFLSKRFGADIAKCITENYFMEFDMVTYTPLSKKSLRKRDYNQAYLLAREVSKRLDIPLVDLLIKVRKTDEQKTLSAQKRKTNVYGAFDLKDKDIVLGKRILLIDDVKTTGSTLNECAKMLNIYGAESVWAATLAVAVPKEKGDRK